MNEFKQSVEKMLKGAFQAVATFPAASISGVLFTITTMIRTQVEGVQADEYHLLFNSLHWAFALGAIFGLMSVTYARSKQSGKTMIRLANGVTGIVSLSAFLLLYFFGQRIPSADSYFQYPYLSNLANTRMGILMGITFLAFILFATRPKENPNLSRSIFMTQKAFLVSAIYGVVLLAGTSAVAGAIQGLLYPEMSFKVYQHLGSIIGFVAFLLFLGYLPDFSKNETDEKRQEAEQQSKFIQLLFSYILVPITLALTVVLLLWTIRIIFQGVGENFLRLSSIATSYAVVGIWLHMMVQEAENKLAKFYLKVFPFATLIILAFEGWALLNQLITYGMQTIEYSFILFWFVAVTGMVLLLLKKQKAYPKILILTMAAMLFSVLPIVGYHSLPVRLQTQRLETLLTEADMFKNNQIVPGSSELQRPLREKITLSAEYLASQDEKVVPTWLTIDPYDTESFIKVMGFEPIYPKQDDQAPLQNAVTNVSRKNQAIAIANFDWRVPLNYQDQKQGQVGEFEGKAGKYVIEWLFTQEPKEVPTLKITLNDQVILEEKLTEFLADVLKEYPAKTEQRDAIMVDTLQMPFSTEELEGILVFNNIEITIDSVSNETTYWMDVEGVYVTEK